MLGTLIWRTKEAVAVFLGRKKTLPKTIKTTYEPKNFKALQPFEIIAPTTLGFLKDKKIEFIFSEFNASRVNAGGADLSQHSRLDPSLSSLRSYFPDAQYTVYSDFDLEIEGVNLNKIENPILSEDQNNPRHFYHLADYYKFKGMLNSDADIAVAIDSDMFVWSDAVYSLLFLTEKFGFCVPNSSAQCMNFEIATSLDTSQITDDSGGYGTTVNITPMSLAKNSERGRKYYESCCSVMEQEPSRASIVMWKAAWKTGEYPYLLPKEFCVVRGSEGIGNEVILHVGHPSVAEYYNIKI